jgi:hypothetical protein
LQQTVCAAVQSPSRVHATIAGFEAGVSTYGVCTKHASGLHDA